MASGLEQTRRNSAILGCLTLSSIFASFPSSWNLPSCQAVDKIPIGSLGSRIGLRIGSDWYFRFQYRRIILGKAVFNYGQPFVSKLWRDIRAVFSHVYLQSFLLHYIRAFLCHVYLGSFLLCGVFIPKYMTIFLQTRIYLKQLADHNHVTANCGLKFPMKNLMLKVSIIWRLALFSSTACHYCGSVMPQTKKQIETWILLWLSRALDVSITFFTFVFFAQLWGERL